MERLNAESGIIEAIGANGFKLFGVLFFALMAYVLYRIGVRKGK
jgi:hypothetical protein